MTRSMPPFDRGAGRDRRSRPDQGGQDAFTPEEMHDVRSAALGRRARERLDRLVELQEVSRLDARGLSQRDIAELLHTTQPRVHRLLQAARLIQSRLPEELILRARVEEWSRADLVEKLKDLDYTFRSHAPGPFEGASPGTWDQVTSAVTQGLLSKGEFERVRDAVKPPASR